MKRWQFVGISVLGLMMGCGLLAGPALSQGRGQGFRPCPYTPYSCPVKSICKPFDESGKVVRVFSETLEDSMQPGMALVMDTKTRGQVQVSLGPVWYLERQEFELKPGDEVQVRGMHEKEKDGKLRVIGFELIKGDYVLSLRDAQGRPNWEAWRKK
jgi:hypothetical protein